MHTIDLEFFPFNEVTLDDAIARYGVYVLWKPAASRCPSYIGEGKLLGRLGEHVATHGDNVDGYFAPIDGAPGKSKHDGHVAEAMLIFTATWVGRPPRHNRNAGRLERVRSLGHRLGVLRVNVRNRDPFQPPWSTVSQLAKTRTIRVDFRALDREEDAWLIQPWHQTRAPAGA
ncbi:MAG TPA: hypothetical protein VGM06_05500 [Polyangiaceae bacterium]|jgi:hypothetical protein